MGRVDPGAVHASIDEVAHEGVVGRRLGGHGDHDPGGSPRRRGPEERVGLLLEQPRPLPEADRRLRSGPGRLGAEEIDEGADLGGARQHVGLGAAE